MVTGVVPSVLLPRVLPTVVAMVGLVAPGVVTPSVVTPLGATVSLVGHGGQRQAVDIPINTHKSTRFVSILTIL